MQVLKKQSSVKSKRQNIVWLACLPPDSSAASDRALVRSSLDNTVVRGNRLDSLQDA